MNAESWKPIPGAPHHYASDQGRISSYRGRRDGRVLKLTVSRGHLVVNIFFNGSWRTRFVHQLVLEAFVGPRPDGTEVRHLNDDGCDNRLENLQWGDRSANMFDRVKNGIHHYAKRDRCKHGHAFTSETSYVRRRPNGTTLRVCRACRKNSKDGSKARRAGVVA